ncbi:hypothetical protein EWM64_g8940 [Hericium alpestre]|uniref:WDR36/Utp21 C-terminal domain-containing protein n=1 Tax=Hericium alpestre TaxID=135208 RepID=A0A4Y9ZK06_9AGAM|nr:hypothetical protein EWM64_g8940 [Hericium alpestre]
MTGVLILLAQSVCMSTCRNFGFIGSSTGDIIMYNMQSGSQRRSFDLGKRPGSRKERRSMTGIATDTLNRTVIASTLDGTLCFFDFFTAKLVHSVQFPAAITWIDLHLDSVIRTFDIPTGRLIDSFKTPNVARSASFSPTSDFLATSHVDSVAVHLWANCAQYGDVSLRSSTGLKATSLKLEQDLSILNDKLVTLTLLPPSRWQMLLRFGTTQWNKAKEPPKALEYAPFFLLLLSKPDSASTNEKQATCKNMTKRLQNTTVESAFLKNYPAVQMTTLFFRYAESLSPAATDAEIQSLTTLDDLQLFFRVLTGCLRCRRDFEAMQMYPNMLLRKHSDMLQANAEVRDALEGLLRLQKQESERMLDLIAASVGTLTFLRDTIS